MELPILDPCHEDYAGMHGTPQRRFCDKCDKHVHDLSEMTEREAKALLVNRDGGRLCVRYRCGADGRIKFRPTPRKAAFVALVSLAMAACTGYAEPDSLESPDSASLCRDASGYAIDCTLADSAVIPEVRAQPEPSEPESTEPEPEPEPHDELVFMGDIAPEPLPCPLPKRGTNPAPQGEPLMGEVREPTRRERRKMRRAERRAQRQREAPDDELLMGVVVEAE